MTAQQLVDRDLFAAFLGARLVEEGTDRLVVEMTVTPDHCDRAGSVAPGVLFSLADCAMSLISNRAGPAVAVATHLVRLAVPTPGTSLRAEICRVTAPRDRATTWHSMVYSDDRVVAQFTGTTWGLRSG